jgi:glucosamine-6-phosphate isomerase
MTNCLKLFESFEVVYNCCKLLIYSLLSNHLKPSQTISNHLKPSQTISNHLKPSQTISNHLKPSQTTTTVQLFIHPDYASLSGQAAREMLEIVKRKPDCLIGVVSGDSPKLAYDLFVEKARQEKLDVSRCRFAGFDEWVGIPPENEGSCHYFLHKHLFLPLGLPKANYHVFNALSGDLENECHMMNDFVAQCGGMDLLLVGVGMNGHIGFNEPGVDFDQYAHVQELEDITLTVGQKYFKEATALRYGITLGLRHLMEAERVLMLANGQKKAAIMKQALEEPVSAAVPASIIRNHPDSLVLLDEAAAGALG